ncbi:MAG: alpha/beta hydrolase [Halioglobus sp.]|nr:alpha/beta hydrolase [Halioglobus sp.]
MISPAKILRALATAGSLLLLWALALPGYVQAASAPIALWPHGAPGSEDWNQVEVESTDFLPHRIVRNVVEPTLKPYLADPDNNTGLAVIVAPGGGFQFLSMDTEGTQVAEWLRERGVNAFLLKYRLDATAANPTLFKIQVYWMMFKAWAMGDEDYPDIAPSPAQPLASADALAAIALVRANADEWRVRPDAIGLIGFSAGSFASLGAVEQGRGVERPDFAALIYGPGDPGKIPENAPPLYIVATEDDPLFHADLSRNLHQRWLDEGHSSTLAIYPDGGHGFGMQEKGATTDGWIEEFHTWLLATTAR